MASLTSIRNGIGSNLSAISSLSVFNYVPDSIEPPTAVVGVVETVEYDTTIQRGADKYEIPVFVYVSRVDAQDSQETLDSYLASTGSSSIKTKIELVFLRRRLWQCDLGRTLGKEVLSLS